HQRSATVSAGPVAARRPGAATTGHCSRAVVHHTLRLALRAQPRSGPRHLVVVKGSPQASVCLTRAESIGEPCAGLEVTTMHGAQECLDRLRKIVGANNVLTAPEDLIPYSFDGTAAWQQLPGCVLFATSTEQIAAVLRVAHKTRTAVVTRGSGTGLSG